MKIDHTNKYIFELEKLLDLIDNITDERLKINIRNQIIKVKDISKNMELNSKLN